MNRNEFLHLVGAGTAGYGIWSLTGCRELAQDSSENPWSHGTWIGGPWDTGSDEEWQSHFQRLKAGGIDQVLIKLEPDDYERVVPIARDEGLVVHAWMIAMMQGGMEEEHREWYAINGKGESTADKPAYVDYYKFMCPSREPVRAHLDAQVARLAQIDGLESVHLDYIRYPDVILPISLWEKYGIVQDREYPEYDYCYCDVCRQMFQEQSGVDPLELEDPSANTEWLQFRYDNITSVVNRLADVAHSYEKKITAAVFPTPEIAKKLVRQDWVNWNLDAFMPMIYHSFYEEPVSWIEQATREGVDALGGSRPLYSGLFIPELNPEELKQATELSLSAGAAGVILFEGKMLEDEHLKALVAGTTSHSST